MIALEAFTGHIDLPTDPIDLKIFIMNSSYILVIDSVCEDLPKAL